MGKDSCHNFNASFSCRPTVTDIVNQLNGRQSVSNSEAPAGENFFVDGGMEIGETCREFQFLTVDPD